MGFEDSSSRIPLEGRNRKKNQAEVDCGESREALGESGLGLKSAHTQPLESKTPAYG